MEIKDIQKNLSFRKKTGFTLAEVLFTLVVIGIVSALVIPALINNINKHLYVSKLKSVYSVLSQAHSSLCLDYGTIGDISGTGFFVGNLSHAQAWNGFKQKLNLVKDCGNTTNAGCWPSVPYRYLYGGSLSGSYDNSTDGKGILADGSLIALYDYNTNCNTWVVDGPLEATCASIKVDINGFRGPNQYGRDYFRFYIAKSGIYPFGSYDDGYDDCDLNEYGHGCAYRVLKEGDMNY